jgi:two-component system, chemotaxis family, CheB/CheR fusion protein
LDRLLETVFINVTAFFRDPDAWVSLRRQVEELFEVESAVPIRVWCAGVSSGEEAYSVAMVLADHLGAAPFRSRVTVYATDVDDDVVALARRGLYTATQVEHVPAGLREAYLEQTDDRFTLRSDLRESLLFGRHDLLQDAPIAGVDLLVCRNTLMYFNRETQDRTLARFHSALNSPGLLFLGRAEMLLGRRHLFEPVDGGARIFRKVERVSPQELDRTSGELQSSAN